MSSLSLHPMDFVRDCDVVVPFARDMFVVTHGDDALFRRDYGEAGERYMDALRALVDVEFGFASVASLNGSPCGFLAGAARGAEPDYGYLYCIYLVPGARGAGLGNLLVAHAERHFGDCGFRMAKLSVGEANTRAIRLYEKRGWRDAGPRPDIPRTIYMVKALTPAAAPLETTNA